MFTSHAVGAVKKIHGRRLTPCLPKVLSFIKETSGDYLGHGILCRAHLLSSLSFINPVHPVCVPARTGRQHSLVKTKIFDFFIFFLEIPYHFQ
jgi:hypothetical protein